MDAPTSRRAAIPPLLGPIDDAGAAKQLSCLTDAPHNFGDAQELERRRNCLYFKLCRPRASGEVDRPDDDNKGEPREAWLEEPTDCQPSFTQIALPGHLATREMH